MTPTVAQELLLVVCLSVMLLLPGLAFISLSGTASRWPGIQRLFVAVGLSISFYPILFYLTRSILPTAHLNRWVLLAILAIALLITLRQIWQERNLLAWPGKLEWVALAVLGLTLLSRFYFAHAHPFPAWSDSLHHTILTQLTAESGTLPRTMEPFFPNKLDMYHLGLYALSGSLQALTQLPAHTALLWTSQILNGLCGLGLYLVLDRYTGRTGAVVGLAVAGLFSVHPALWANWGRFTQLASVVLLPFAWLFFLESLRPAGSKNEGKIGSRQQIWLSIFAATSNAAVFFLHFRVGIFQLFLLGTTAVFLFISSRSRQQWLAMLRPLLLIAALFLLIIFPTLWDAAAAFLAPKTASLSQAEAQQVQDDYYKFPLSTIPYLVAPLWLLIIAGLASLVGLFRRKLLVGIQLVWALLMILLGNLYRLNIPALSFTNLGAVLIMLYIPISIIIGVAVQELLLWLPDTRRRQAVFAILTLVVLAGFPATYRRATMVEPDRHFVTDQDLVAMEWIEENTPVDGTFAINTYQWLPRFAHGTDAGYWIPYLAHRKIVTTAMLSDGLNQEYRQLVHDRSQAVDALESDLNALHTLYNLGVEYIYIGAKGDFSGPGLQLDFLTQSKDVQVLYQQGETAVLQINPQEN